MISKNEKYKKDSQAGFTLIELLVVLGIIAAVITVLMSSFTVKTQSAELKKHALTIAAELRNLRSTAIRKNQDAIFSINVKSGQYQIEKGRKARIIGDDIAIKLLTAKSEVITEKLGRIRFFPDGSSTGGTLILKTEKFEEKILIDWLTGTVKLHKAVNYAQ